MFGFYEWLLQLPKPVQYALALLLLGASSLACRYGWMSPWGWTIGFILLWVACFGKPRDEADE